MKYAAININFDSLNEAYGFPKDYSDPSFNIVADRFLHIAEKYNFKYSIYVIGKDLEKEENRVKVKEWANKGHEIGNHSWSHPLNLGALDKHEIHAEIIKAHDIIANTIGYAPKGFISPGWSTSKALRHVLMDIGYEYDTSSYPSLLMYPMLIKMLINHIGNKRFFSIINRKDLHYPIFSPRQAHIETLREKSIVCLPLPTTPLRIACWHTTAFLFGWKTHKRLLNACLNSTDYFYYLAHPADLIGPKDLDQNRPNCLERTEYNIEHKMSLFEDSIKEVINSGRKIITMQALAEKVRQNNDSTQSFMKN